jgi:hypothetical protein
MSDSPGGDPGLAPELSGGDSPGDDQRPALDLSAEDAKDFAGPELVPLPKDFSIPDEHDWLRSEGTKPWAQPDSIRFLLVFGLLIILGAIVGLGFAGLFSQADLDTQRNVLEAWGIFVSPVTTLLGAATGFYFGREAAAKEGRSGQ